MTTHHGRHLPQGDSLKIKLLLAVALALSLSVVAQTNSQTTMAVEPMNPTPTFRVNVISRSVRAVNYKHRGGATKLDFAGTDLMPKADGQAKVESKKGYIEIEVEFGNLQKPTTFGNEYLTYILWAAVMKMRETRTRLIQLVLSMGVYFSLFAANFALQNLYQSRGNFFEFLTPLFGCFLPLSWAYTFWHLPEDARIVPSRLAVVPR